MKAMNRVAAVPMGGFFWGGASGASGFDKQAFLAAAAGVHEAEAVFSRERACFACQTGRKVGK